MNILVIGDIMLDVNFFSKVERNAPEADIPIYNVDGIRAFLGGAANVAKNLHNLNVNVELISVIGKDSASTKIKKILEEQKLNHTLFVDKERKTTQKNRIFVKNQLCVRYDVEDNHYIDEEIEDSILSCIATKKDLHAIVISDYDKGVVTYCLCKNIIDYCNENRIYTFIDPKIKNVEKYKNCFCFKPNLKEGQIISNEKEIELILKAIKTNLSPLHTVLTCSEKGIYVDSVENHIQHNRSTIEVVDVTGAGDTVLSVLVYIFLQKKDLFFATKVANYIAGKSVQQQGNYTVSIEDINDYYQVEEREKKQKNLSTKCKNKIIFDYEADKITELSLKKNIVFTNGCFDIIHSAHIQNLIFAKEQGDCLVVGLNTDASVRRLKGNERPINNQEERSKLLSLFDFVDYIILFSEDTPYSILQMLRPVVLVKGSDYKKEEIVGAECVEKVVLFDYVEGKSSTHVINRIKNL